MARRSNRGRRSNSNGKSKTNGKSRGRARASRTRDDQGQFMSGE